MQQKDSAEWILRTTRRILRKSGPRAAKRFLESRGGTSKWEAAAREVGRAVLSQTEGKSFPRFIKFLNF